MDIEELLAFKPEQTPKRSHDDDEDDDEVGHDAAAATSSKQQSQAKRLKRIADAKEAAQFVKPQSVGSKPQKLNFDPTLSEEECQRIIRFVENEEPEGEVLDENSLKKLVLLFEKRIVKNQEMRIKHADNPEKFMDSELELHAVIQELKAIATVPDLYPLWIELGGLHSLLELLAHPNTDIAVTIVELLQDVTDIDILGESAEGTEALMEALRKEQIFALLVQNMERLDEQVKEESDGVHESMSIVENLSEIQPQFIPDAAQQGMLAWLLKRLKAKPPFDSNKLYCSEILSIIIQDDDENRLLLGTLGGIDVLLQQFAVYKRHDPASADEQEFMQNIINCLCSALLRRENLNHFLNGEGLQLMNLMLREKKMSRSGALKILDFALSGPDGRENCNKFVDILGLRTIFPLFMKTPKKHKKMKVSRDEHEEHIVAAIGSMLRNCRGAQRQRLLAKFSESDHEKVERLLELHLKYLAKVDEADRLIETQQRQNRALALDEEENYMTRLSAGLFTLQMIDFIILEICASAEAIKQRVVKILSLHKASMKVIRDVMREYIGNLGDSGGIDWKEQEQTHILSLIDRF